MKILKALFFTLVIMSLLVVVGCSSGKTAAVGEEERVFDVSLPLGEDSHHDIGLQKFNEELKHLTDDRLSIRFHYNNELGGEREIVEAMGVNTVDMGLSSTGPIGSFVKEVQIFDLPYIINDTNHAYAVLDNEIGDELAEKIEETGNVKVLAWWENGYRYQTNDVRPIVTPDDLKGIKHRTQESEVQVDTWKTLGADATPMAWPEVYTGLQQGVIDSQENPIPTILDVRFYEVQKYLSLTQHVYSPLPLMMSKELYDSLSDADQEALMEAAKLATPIQREASAEQTEESLNELEENGMEIIDVDLDAFRDKVQPVHEKWAPKIDEDLYNDIINYEY